MTSRDSTPAVWLACSKRSVARNTDVLYPPHRPRSATTDKTATRATVSGVPSSRPAASGSPVAVSSTTRAMPSWYGLEAAIRPWARTICEAAMSSIALVIFLVDWMLLIRRRRMRS